MQKNPFKTPNHCRLFKSSYKNVSIFSETAKEMPSGHTMSFCPYATCSQALVV